MPPSTALRTALLSTLIAASPLTAANYTNPVIPTPAGDTQYGADPYVVNGNDGYYYIYFTDGNNSSRMRSTDLVNWSNKTTMSIGQAPHVYYDAATSKWNLMGNLALRQSTSPTNAGSSATFNGYALTSYGFDPYQFTDPADNQSYLYTGGWQYRHAINVLSSPTNSTQTIYPHLMDGWWGNVWEGPTILENNGTYYWFISMNGANTPSYSLAYATAPSPKGPWEMQTWDNAACFARRSNFETIYGPGHPGIIQDNNGTWWLYYQHKLSTVTDWDRKIAIDPIWFDTSGVPHTRLTRAVSRPGPNSSTNTIWPVISAADTLIEAETYAGSAIADLLADSSRTVLTNLKSRAYLAYRHLDFGATGVNGIEFTLRNDLNQAGGTGSIEVRTGGVSGPLVGVLPLTYVNTSYRTASVALNQTLTGTHDIFLVIQGAKPETNIVRLDSFKFLTTAPGSASPMPPVANDDIAYVPLNTAVTFNPLANDANGGTGTLAITGLRTTGHAGTTNGGTAVLNPDNTITYTPAANYWGEDRITYALSNGTGAFREGEIILRIHPGTTIHPDANGTAVIEAESYNQIFDSGATADTSAWTTASTLADASGGSYAVTPDNSSGYGNSRLDYALDIRTPGIYKIWLRCSQPNTSGNSFRLALSTRGSTSAYDNFTTTLDNGTQTANTWYWVSLADLRALRPGLHRLSISRNEDGLAIDKIVVTTDATYDPATDNAGQGPAATTLTPDNNPGQTLTLSAATLNVTEGNTGSTNATLTVARTGGSTGAISVAYATADDTATAGTDYTATTGTLTWANGDTADKTITIPVLGDTTVESSDSFPLTLTNPTGGASLGLTTTATITITNDDLPNAAPLVFITAPTAVNSTNPNLDAPLTLNATVTDDTSTPTITWSAISTPAGGNVIFSPTGTADTTATFSTPGTYLLRLSASDGEFTTSSYRQVTAGLGNVKNYLYNADFEIDPDQSQTITGWSLYTGTNSGNADFVDATGTHQNGARHLTHTNPGVNAWDVYTYQVVTGLTNGNYRLTAWARKSGSGYTDANIWAESYSTPYTYLTADVPTSDTYQRIDIRNIPVTDGQCTIGLWTDVSAASGNPTVHYDQLDFHRESSGTLALSAANVTTPEGTSGTAQLTLTVTRLDGSDNAISVAYATANGTATAGTDYTTTAGTLTWADLDYSPKTITIPILGDTIVETDETFTLTLTTPTGGATLGTTTATITITNDDTPLSAWTAGIDWQGADSSPTAIVSPLGVSNLMLYALDIDSPFTADTSKLPALGTDTTTPGGPWLTYTYRKKTSATDLTYTVRSSTDLLTWTDLTIDNVNTIETTADANPDGDNSATLIQIRVKHDPATQPKRFLRLKVTQ